MVIMKGKLILIEKDVGVVFYLSVPVVVVPEKEEGAWRFYVAVCLSCSCTIVHGGGISFEYLCDMVSKHE